MGKFWTLPFWENLGNLTHILALYKGKCEVGSNYVISFQKWSYQVVRLEKRSDDSIFEGRWSFCFSCDFSKKQRHLTHSFPVHPFSTPENIRKPYGFLIFSGG